MGTMIGVAVGVGIGVSVGNGGVEVKVIVTSGVTVTCGVAHPTRIEVRMVRKRMDFFMNNSRLHKSNGSYYSR